MSNQYAYLVVVAICVTVFLVLSKEVVKRIEDRRFSRAHGCKPPIQLPQSERVLGIENFIEQIAVTKQKRSLPLSLARFRQIGNTYTIAALSRTIVLTIEPQNVKSILSVNFKDYSLGMRMEALGVLLGAGIFTSDGANWEHSRALVRPSFTKDRVADLDTFENHIQNLLAKIPRDGSSVDLQKLFFQLTLDSATEFLLGESVNSLTSPEGSQQLLFGQAFDAAQNELPKRLRLGPFLWLYRNKEFDKSCKIVHNYIDKFVETAVNRQNEKRGSSDDESSEKSRAKYIFVDELAAATKDPIRIRSELLNILLAGRDTTAGLLSNTFHVLARRPDIWDKLATEIGQLNGKRPDYETLRNLKYLKYVLNESLRLFPSVPMNARFASKNTTLPLGGGSDGQSPLFIPKGRMVLWSTYSMHRRRDLYGDDADEYKPERWEKLRVGWEYLPFNGGPRICIGQQFALTEAGYTIVRMVQEFARIESKDSREWVEGLHLTLSSGNPVEVELFPRSSLPI